MWTRFFGSIILTVFLAPTWVGANAVISENAGNRNEMQVVQESDSAGSPRAVSNTASAGSFQGNDSSGMIPWALALLGVIALGSTALLFQGKPRGSGYSIIEEKQ